MEVLRIIIWGWICVFPFTGITQQAFFKKYTSGPFDQGNGITQLPNDYYAVTGSSGGFSSESSQAYIMMLDPAGNQVWTKNYGGAGEDVGVRIIHVENEGFYVAGYTGSTAEGDFDFALWKTDESGELEWEKKYGGENWEILHDAKMLSDGSLVLVGETEGATTKGKDIFMVRTDAMGDTLWTKTIQTEEDDVATCIDTIGTNQFVIGGSKGKDGVSTGMFAIYDYDGEEELLQFRDEDGFVFVSDIEVFNNKIYVVGGLYDEENEHYDVWGTKNELDGELIKVLLIPHEGESYSTKILIKNSQAVYIVMETDSPDLDPYPYGVDALIMRLDENLYYNGFSANFSGYDDDHINQMIVTSDDGFALVGTVSDDPFIHSLGTDVMVAKIGPNEEVIEVSSSEDLLAISEEDYSTKLMLYPNPAQDNIYLPEEVVGMTFRITSMQGSLVLSGNIKDSTMDVSKLGKGVYFFTVADKNHVWNAKFIKE